jgi:Na+/H+ antiporter NhaD/arsenite permease-like protein
LLGRELAGLLVVAFLLLSMVARSRRPGLPVWSLMAFASFLTILLGLVSVNARACTIVFFISMFVTMKGVWRSGVFNPLLSALLPSRLEGAAGVLAITAASLLMSQVISNVPFARFFVLYMKSLGYTSGDDLYWVTLAASSTIAGNLTPLGAASNIIVMEYLESRMNTTILLKDFVKVGFLVTAVNTSIYLLWLLLLSAA